MNINRRVLDLQLRLEAIELLLISRGETNQENLGAFQGQAQDNYSKARDEFQRKQWAKIKLGSIIEYELTPVSSLSIEIISVSPNPFGYLAGKIINKEGRNKYRVGQIFTISHPVKISIKLPLGSSEIISRE